jgi:hypothetical protein
MVVPVVDPKNVKQLLHLLSGNLNHGGSLIIIKRLIKRLIAVAGKL